MVARQHTDHQATGTEDFPAPRFQRGFVMAAASAPSSLEAGSPATLIGLTGVMV
jgi:hypothetical protein